MPAMVARARSPRHPAPTALRGQGSLRIVNEHGRSRCAVETRPVDVRHAGGLFVFGLLGYWLLEEWSLLDAAYMTVITLTTVGFKEVRPLDSNGRIFTIVLLVMGVGLALISVAGPDRAAPLIGRSIRPDLQIVARASEPGSPERLGRAGANRVVSPSVTSGQHMAKMAMRPELVDVI